jgi:iron complex outermembrane receptor protein
MRSFLLSGAAALAFVAIGQHEAIAGDLAATAPTGEPTVIASAPAAPGDQSQAVAEVVVTAEKRSERLQDVPMSIATASGAQLKDLGVTDPSMLEKLVPGFSYTAGVNGVPVFTIRGVGFYDTTLAAVPAVSVYVDQIPVPYLAMARGATLDVERLEVLKGPQGTLFGESSTGGAINYIAAKPTQTFQAGADVSYGRFNDTEAEQFISGPLSDTLSARLALREEYRGPWQESQSRDDQLGTKNFLNSRLTLDWKPTDRLQFEATVSAWLDRSDMQAAQLISIAPVNPNGNQATLTALENELAQYGQADTNARSADWTPGNLAQNSRFVQVGLHATYDINDHLRLTSLTAYSDLKTDLPNEPDGTSYPNIGFVVDGLIQSFFQELRLEGEANDRVKYMVGLNYQKDHANEVDLDIPMSSSSSSPAGEFGPYYIQNFQNIQTEAAFGSLDFQLTPKLTLQSSVRYTNSDNSFAGCMRDPGTGQLVNNLYVFLQEALAGRDQTLPPGSCITLNPANLEPVGIVHSSLDEDNVSARGSLNWKPNDDTLLYFSLTRGYKAGSFPSLPAVFENQFQPVRQESVNAYEAGFKLTLLDRSLVLDGAGFYYDYTNKQILNARLVEPFGPLPALITVPKATVAGAELTATWRPITGLAVTGGATYVYSRIDSNPVAPFAAYDTNGNVVSFIGEQFPSTPKYQLVGDVDYQFPLSSDWNGFVGANASYRGGTPTLLGGTPGYYIKPYGLLDLRAGIEDPSRGWRLSVWGRNVTNTYYQQNIFHAVDTMVSLAGMPVTYGVELAYRFH